MKMNRYAIHALFVFGMWLGLGLQAHGQTRTVHYYYTDPQGTPLVKTDAQGNVIARYDYTPYGNPVTSLGSPPNGPGYTGHVNDPETGLVYMKARYYQPDGRFPSPDAVRPVPGNIYSFNRYAYADNNPIVHDDPTGMFSGDMNDARRNWDNWGNKTFWRDSHCAVCLQTSSKSARHAVFNFAVQAAEDLGEAVYYDLKNAVTEEFKSNTYAISLGLSGTLATPLGVPFASPSVGVTSGVNLSLNTHGQVAVNGSIGPVVGTGGGASGGVAVGLARARGGAVPRGFSYSYTKHVEGDFSAPGVPVTFGLAADWNKDGIGGSSATRFSYGPLIFFGGGVQANASYTFNN